MNCLNARITRHSERPQRAPDSHVKSRSERAPDHRSYPAAPLNAAVTPYDRMTSFACSDKFRNVTNRGNVCITSIARGGAEPSCSGARRSWKNYSRVVACLILSDGRSMSYAAITGALPSGGINTGGSKA